MTKKKETLRQALDYADHSREKRSAMAELILQQPELISPLLEIALDVNDPISCKAFWILEFTAHKKLAFLYPHIDRFISGLSTVHLDSAVRPAAKICELLTLSYFSKKEHDTRKIITSEHLNQITSACFDWLIGNHKVAAKAYSMTSLLLLGQKIDWVHQELKMILEQNYAEGSAAYKARARMTLAKLKHL